jgi:K+-transporting ATPase c subunit
MNMGKIISKSLWLLGFTIVLGCGLYPFALWAIGQTVFPFQANGSMLTGPDGKIVGSLLIAQPFTKDGYFKPRPSAAGYDGSASCSSALAASNPALRSRVAQQLGPIVVYKSGPKAGKPVAPDVVAYFQEKNPGKAPAADTAATYFDTWRQAHPDAELQDIPGDMVTTSGSGLDPHITLQNAEYQLDAVSAKWAAELKRDPSAVRGEIKQIIEDNASAPFGGLIGEKIVNVLEVNLALRTKYGAPQ